MNIIKYFFKNVWANRAMFIIYITIFAILLLISTAGDTKNAQSVFEETKAKVGVILLSDDMLATELVSYLQEYVGEEAKLAYLADDIPKAKEQIFMGNYDAIVRIPEDFKTRFEKGEQAVQILFNTVGYSGRLVESRVQGFLTFVEATKENGEYHVDKAKKILSAKTEVSLLEQEGGQDTDRDKTWTRIFFNKAGYVLTAIYIAVIGMSMTDFDHINTKQRVAVSSKKLKSFQIEIYIAQMLVGAMITFLIILVAFALKGRALLEQEIVKYILNLFVFSATIMALTFMINDLTNSNSAKNALSTIISIGSAFISGMIIPQEILSDKVLAVAKFLPTYYFVLINDKAAPESSFLIQNLLIQSLFGVLFLVLGIYFAKKRRVVE
ncbi:MAG: ABC transporter permease [Peptostreptococcaceae bacterium]|nr:ABC transporter permease [Peptostreptococcaceae bacterium]